MSEKFDGHKRGMNESLNIDEVRWSICTTTATRPVFWLNFFIYWFFCRRRNNVPVQTYCLRKTLGKSFCKPNPKAARSVVSKLFHLLIFFAGEESSLIQTSYRTKWRKTGRAIQTRRPAGQLFHNFWIFWIFFRRMKCTINQFKTAEKEMETAKDRAWKRNRPRNAPVNASGKPSIRLKLNKKLTYQMIFCFLSHAMETCLQKTWACVWVVWSPFLLLNFCLLYF